MARKRRRSSRGRSHTSWKVVAVSGEQIKAAPSLKSAKAAALKYGHHARIYRRAPGSDEWVLWVPAPGETDDAR